MKLKKGTLPGGGNVHLDSQDVQGKEAVWLNAEVESRSTTKL